MAVFTKRQYRQLTGMRMYARFVVHLYGADQSEGIELFKDLAALCQFVAHHCPDDINLHAAYGELIDEVTTELWLAWHREGGALERAQDMCHSAMAIASKP